MKKKLLKIFGIICITLLIAGVYFYFNILIPHNKFRNMNWFETAAPEEQREVAHKILSYPFGNHHDAYLVLVKYGNEESIPYLLNRLKQYKDNDFMECTQDHCIESLKKITGKNLGHNYDDWNKELKNR